MVSEGDDGDDEDDGEKLVMIHVKARCDPHNQMCQS